MSKWKGKTGAKIAAWLLAVISSIVFAGSVLAAAACESAGIYEKSESVVLQSVYKNIAERYAYRAMDYRNTDEENETGNKSYFDGTNFQYGIIETNGKSLASLDLNNEANYQQRNFTGEIKEGDYWEYDFAVADDTYFVYGDSIWNTDYYYRTDTCDVEYPISECIYEAQSGIFYYYGDGVYYPVQSIEIPVEEASGEVTLILAYDSENQDYQVQIFAEAYGYLPDGETTDATMTESAAYDSDIQILSDDGVESLIQAIMQTGEVRLNELDGTMLGSDYWTTILLDGQSYDFNTSIPQMYFSTDDVSVSDMAYYEAGEGYLLAAQENAQINYAVVAVIPQGKLINDGNWSQGDLFVKAKILTQLAFSLRYTFFVFAVLSLVTFLASLIFLIQASGHRMGTEEIVLTWLDKIPADIYAVLFFTLTGLVLACVSEVCSHNIQESSFYAILFGMGILVLELMGIGALLSMAVRIKYGKWWKNTIVVKMMGVCGRIIKKVFAAVPAAGIAGAVFVGLSVIEFFAILITGYNPGKELFLWFVEKILLAAVLLKIAVQMRKLQEAGEHIASGDTEYKTDTAKMMPDFRKHGENLNNIGLGITKAVDERMKSERFKTELITNVSHDIKTPLTSIINYVDLLEKEDLHNEKAAEYLEVLERQSARLKKLIEDLMEASKASTGNLAVNMELCEAGVFLVQTIGEFGERTEQMDLDLVIKSPEEPVYIMADGRHFWRVIDNLMNNICKYAQAGTRVYINLEAKDEVVTIIFRNTSRYPLNITSEELLERFVRGDSSRNTEGNGLGLNIAQNLTELMNGTFELVVDGDLFKVILKFPQVSRIETENP